jgi:type I restriction enzyme S subunit
MLMRVTGSTGSRQRVPQKEVASIPIILPPPDIAEQLISQFNDFQSRTTANTEQSATLADIRDTLLPKLISGEIRIPDAERAVEEAV